MKHSRILIVEDDPAVQRALSDWLSDDYEILCFNSAEEFLEPFNNFDFEDGVPTCILLDFQMPGMTGVQLQDELRAINNAYPIAFMSGNANQSEIIDAWRGGAVDFILKPFTGPQISVALEKLFRSISKNHPTIEPIKEVTDPIRIPISKREAEALLLLGSGHRQNEVAVMMGVSLRTIKMYRANLKNKLGLYTPVDISRYCDRYKSQISQIANTIGNN